VKGSGTCRSPDLISPRSFRITRARLSSSKSYESKRLFYWRIEIRKTPLEIEISKSQRGRTMAGILSFTDRSVAPANAAKNSGRSKVQIHCAGEPCTPRTRGKSIVDAPRLRLTSLSSQSSALQSRSHCILAVYEYRLTAQHHEV
jgi:hypothetical protein